MRKILTSALLLTTAACASHPDKMGATYVSPIKYAEYNCSQIASEQEAVSLRTIELYHKLKKTRKADNWQMGVGLVLLWPTLFFLEGGDGVEATEYSHLKGEYEALRQTNIKKSCDLDFMASTDELIEKEKAKDKAKEKDKEKDKAKAK